jgi:dipeptidyl aminopeptidase/acylaminoacyl peptidase
MTQPETGGRETVIPAQEVELTTMVYRPAGQGPFPAIIICPGGVERGNFEIMEWAGLRAQADGFVAVTLSWRGPSPLHDPDDISAAVDWLQADPDVDGERIGILGISRGGGAALRGAALDHRIKALVTFGPVTNLIQQAEGTAVYAPTRHRMFVQWLGDPVKDRAFYEKVQALSYADRIVQPTLMVHGLHDMHCPIEQSLWMKEAMEKAGHTDIRLELIPMMGHYGDVPPGTYGFDTLWGLMGPFFKEQLAARQPAAAGA